MDTDRIPFLSTDKELQSEILIKLILNKNVKTR